MIDIEAAKRRTAWLQCLQPGDAVQLVCPVGAKRRSAHVEAMDDHRIWIEYRWYDGTDVRTWVWRDSGDCPCARIRIEPAADSQDCGWGAA